MQQIPNIIKNLLKRNLTLDEIKFLLNSKDKNIQHLKTNLRIIMEKTKNKAKDTAKRRNKSKSSKKGKDMTEETLISIIDKAMSPHIFRLEKKIDENKADTDKQIAALRKDIKQANKHLTKIDSRIDNLVKKNNLKE